MERRDPPGYPPQVGQEPIASPQVQSSYDQPLNPQPYSPNVQPVPQYGEGLPPDLSYPWDPQEKQRPRRRRRTWRWIVAVVALLFLSFLIRGLIFASAISTEPLWSAHLLPIGDANVLILGYGGEGHEGAFLTDSLLLLHTGSGGTAQISIPRDLWVQIPPDSGQYAKINSAYAYGRGSAGDPVAGGELVTHKVEQVTGLSTDEWVTIDFRGFRALVDALGGVDIEVENAFSSDYPANDDPTVDPSWITVSFAAGKQHMNGETAIRYARARYADVPEEQGDFARSQRQQRLMSAISAKLHNPLNWWRAFGIMNALQPALKTNLAPMDLLILFLRAGSGNAAHIRIDDSNVLENATSDDGQAILQPRGGDYDLIGQYIRQELEK
jgi:polyisoprenyl-teichoic acid--peptidoglycan teichoic acid transferase